MTRAALVEAFAGFPARLAFAAEAAEPRPTPAGEWRPNEVVRHLIAVESAVWTARLAQLARFDDPQWPWTEPGLAERFEDEPLAAVLLAFSAARAATVATIAALDDEGWGRSGTHATYGRLDVAGLLRIATEHDESHLEGLAERSVA